MRGFRFLACGACLPCERHVDETLKLLSVLTGDRRFEEVLGILPKTGGVGMCEVLDKVENRGIEKGIEQGADKVRAVMALRMIQAGEPDGKIAEYTGLSVSQVKEMRNQVVPGSES